MALLEVRELSVRFPGSEDRPAVQRVDLSVERGAILGLVGETGAGKTLTTRAVVRAIPDGVIEAERIELDGIDLLHAPTKVLRRLRGSKVAIVVQDARSALNPMQRVGVTLEHILRAHERMRRRDARARIISMLDSVGLPDPERVFRRYPHELSGGMAQRVVIAAALVTDPDLIVADEATTGLDVTVQAQILDLLKAEISRRNAAAIVVTHDLGVVAHYCTDVAVMYDGEVREHGPVQRVFASPADPYTVTLLASTTATTPETTPVPAQGNGAGTRDELVEVRDLAKRFALPGRVTLHAVSGVSLDIARGETVALVGESGAGKSTVGRCLLRLIDPDSGTILFDGADVTRESRKAFRRRRTEIQAVFQDPSSSLNHRMRALAIVTEPLAIFRPTLTTNERRKEGLRLMEAVGLVPDLAERFPYQLSGGQQQRLAIARAVATNPRLVVLDEPTASLDMSVRSQVLSLLQNLQRDYGLSYLFISHDLATVRRVATRVVVMYLGEIVEHGPTAEIFARPRHPYTKALLSAELIADPGRPPSRLPLRGEVPRPTDLPDACYFAGRCSLAVDECRAAHPELTRLSDAHVARCIRLDQT